MPTNYPKLKILSSEDRGTVLEMKTKEHTCGRSEDNSFVLNDSSVSSHHCSFKRNELGYTIIDNDSTNGTLVNNMTITSRSLKNEDIVSVGNVELLYDSGDLKNDEKQEKDVKAAITLGNDGGSIPLGEMKNFSPFADKKNSQSKITKKMMIFVCIGLVVASAILLLWILLTSL